MLTITTELYLQSTDRHSSSSGGTMMNESPSHNAAAAAVTTRFPEKPISNSESPSSLVDSAIGGSASPDLMQVMIYRVGMVVGYWVGFTLIWVFHHNAQQTIRFCQISICPGRTLQAVECQNTKSNQPSNQPPSPPCTVG